jgi:hypothetical protein
VLVNLGAFIPSMFVYKDNVEPNIYVLKKKMYSFLKINEYKMHIFRNKKLLIMNNLTSKIKGQGFFNKAIFTSQGIFYSYFKKRFFEAKSNLKHLANVSNSFLNEGVLSKSNLFKYEGNLVYKKLSYSKNLPPVISRVRFRPGYQRI